jgi:beta-ketoacyl synthase-like protein
VRVYIEGIGLRGPGLDGWQASRAVLAGTEAYVPAPTNMSGIDMLPPAERRRAGVPIKLAMAVGQEAFTHARRASAGTATVFTSSGGDNDNVHAICEILVTAPREVSPTRFHNSVHNAAAGYWGIAAQSREPSTSLCGYDGSFAIGLLDAAAQAVVDHVPVALLAYDHPYPEPLNGVRHIEGSFGMALVLTPQRTEHALAELQVNFVPAMKTATVMESVVLEKLRSQNPAARSLPLLAALARGAAAQLVVDYLGDCHLEVTVTPC